MKLTRPSAPTRPRPVTRNVTSTSQFSCGLLIWLQTEPAMHRASSLVSKQSEKGRALFSHFMPTRKCVVNVDQIPKNWLSHSFGNLNLYSSSQKFNIQLCALRAYCPQLALLLIHSALQTDQCYQFHSYLHVLPSRSCNHLNKYAVNVGPRLEG